MDGVNTPLASASTEVAATDASLCLWCDKPSVRFCDAVIGFGAIGARRDKSGKVLSLFTGLDAEHWTCDAPMCADHTKQVGWVCGEEPDSIDRCPHHADRGEKDDLVMFASEAESARRDIYAAVRRARMHSTDEAGK